MGDSRNCIEGQTRLPGMVSPPVAWTGRSRRSSLTFRVPEERKAQVKYGPPQKRPPAIRPSEPSVGVLSPGASGEVVLDSAVGSPRWTLGPLRIGLKMIPFLARVQGSRVPRPPAPEPLSCHMSQMRCQQYTSRGGVFARTSSGPDRRRQTQERPPRSCSLHSPRLPGLAPVRRTDAGYRL
jgi:hypothetical protein